MKSLRDIRINWHMSSELEINPIVPQKPLKVIVFKHIILLKFIKFSTFKTIKFFCNFIEFWGAKGKHCVNRLNFYEAHFI